ADDYIDKPFSSLVVVARFKAVLRLSGDLDGEASGSGAGLTFNGWRLDTTRCELYNPQQQSIPLTQGEYGLLLALAQNARLVLNREQLLALTHNESTEVLDRTIDVLIMRLR
ncbi:winged helix-turn-helix domain-containing protein, partial [Klebsiella pneumoniae]|uniref:winged helix-turn-helix domain-containing protein n=1 Tax=Klebsiella pneumoniae TaxID=573 RepID=UPI00226EAC4D